ncbi:MAG TPA: hypothetical protein VEP28_05835, partial [Rubrobacter sp.]|nr:hypothetical protein [Rubrobacter sp.]
MVPNDWFTRNIRLVCAGMAGLMLGAFPTAAQQPADTLPPRPTLAASAIDQPVKVDGLLDEEAWQQADVADEFIQREPNPGQPATETTEVRVVYTDSILYIGIRALAAEPGQI